MVCSIAPFGGRSSCLWAAGYACPDHPQGWNYHILEKRQMNVQSNPKIVSINVGVDISTNSEGYFFLNQQHYSRTTSATVSVNSKAKYA